MQRETTQSKYRLVEKPQTDANNIQDNEVRITTRGRVANYVQYSLNLLEGTPQGQGRNQTNNAASSDNQQGQQPAQSTTSQPDQQAQGQKQAQEAKPTKKFDTIVLKATGGAITGAVNTAEVVKRRVTGLHQLTKLETLEIEDHWEPIEEGLKPVKTTRRVASISITLTRDQKSIDEKDVGYQEPLPNEAVVNPPRGIGRGFRGTRGGFRGGRGRGGFRGGRGRGGGGFRGGPRGGRGGFRGGPRGGGRGAPRGRGTGFRGYSGNYGGNYGGGFNGGFRGRGGPRGAPRGGPNFRSRGGFRGDRGGRGGL